MRKIIIGLVLVVMAVFSLSADVIVKERVVYDDRDGFERITLLHNIKKPGQYFVDWENLGDIYEKGYSTLEEVYCCSSLTNALKVFNMNRNQLDEKRKTIGVKKYSRTRLVQFYYLPELDDLSAFDVVY